MRRKPHQRLDRVSFKDKFAKLLMVSEDKKYMSKANRICHFLYANSLYRYGRSVCKITVCFLGLLCFQLSYAHSGIVVIVKSGCNEFYVCVGNWHSLTENQQAINTGASGLYIDENQDGTLAGCCNGGASFGSEFIPFTDLFVTSNPTTWANVDSVQLNELTDYFENSSTHNPNGTKFFSAQTIWTGNCANVLRTWQILKVNIEMEPYYEYIARVGDYSVVETPCGGIPEFKIEYTPFEADLVASGNFICKDDSIMLYADDTLNLDWYFNNTLIDADSDTIFVHQPGVYYYTADTSCKSRRSNSLEIYDGYEALELGVNRDLCAGDLSEIILDTSFADPLWSTGSTDSSISVDSTGWYAVRAIYKVSSCPSTDSILVTFHQPEFSLGKDTSFCEGKRVTLVAEDTLCSYLWSTSDTGNTLTVEQPMVLWLKKTDTAGCSYTDTIKLTHYPKPVSTFGITSINNCFNENLFHFRDSAKIDSGFILQYFWAIDSVPFVSRDLLNMKFNSTGYHKISHVVRSEKGCFSDLVLDSILVHPSPKVQAAIVTDSLQCFATQDLRFASVDNISSGSLNRFWDFGDGQTAPGATVSHTYGDHGTYQIKLVVVSDQNCADTAYSQVELYPNPKAKIKVVDSFLCQVNNFVKVRDLSGIDAGGSIASTHWDLGNGQTVSNQIQTTAVYPDAEIYTIVLEAISDQNCEGKDSVIVDIKPNPQGEIISSTDQICLYDGGFLFDTDASIRYGSIDSYLWDFGDGSGSMQRTPALKEYADDNSYEVELVMISDQGCTDTNQLTVVVDTLPEVDFMLGPASNLCFNTHSLDFEEISASKAGTISSWHWDFGESNSNLPNPKGIMFSSAGVKSVRLEVVSSRGCVSAVEKDIVLYNNPRAIFEVESDCYYNEILFNNLSSSTAGDAISKTIWSFGDGEQSDIYNPTHIYQRAKTYKVKLFVESDKGCRDSMLKTDFVVYPAPKADFSYRKVASWETESTFLFENTSSDGLSYVWTFENNKTSTEEGPVKYVFQDSGYKNVRLLATNSFGCVDSIIKRVKVVPDPPLYVPNAFSPFTSPGTNDVFQPLGVGYATEYHLVIYNRWGELVFESFDPNQAWDGRYNGERCDPGVYVYYLSYDVPESFSQHAKGTVLLLD